MEVISCVKSRDLNEEDYLSQGMNKRKTLTRQRIYNIIRDTGIRVIGKWGHPHIFKHGAAMYLMGSGRTTYEIQAWMDHSSPKVTFDTYARVTADTKWKASEESGLQ